MKLYLKDLTFIIPIRIDSINRLENVLAVIQYLRRNLDTHIMVLEASYKTNNFLQRLLPKDVEYYFIEDKDPVFYRTHYLNFMTQKVKTDFLAIWDADVIVSSNQIQEAMQQLRQGKADIAYPYDGSFLDISYIIRRIFLQSRSYILLARHKEKMKNLYAPSGMKGGGILVNRKKYIDAGMENENFYGWGPEDFERYERWKTLGYSIFRSKGCMFHFTHSRDMNGTFNSRTQMRISHTERMKIKGCSAKEILSHLEKNQFKESNKSK